MDHLTSGDFLWESVLSPESSPEALDDTSGQFMDMFEKFSPLASHFSSYMEALTPPDSDHESDSFKLKEDPMWSGPGCLAAGLVDCIRPSDKWEDKGGASAAAAVEADDYVPDVSFLEGLILSTDDVGGIKSEPDSETETEEDEEIDVVSTHNDDDVISATAPPIIVPQRSPEAARHLSPEPEASDFYHPVIVPGKKRAGFKRRYPTSRPPSTPSCPPPSDIALIHNYHSSAGPLSPPMRRRGFARSSASCPPSPRGKKLQPQYTDELLGDASRILSRQAKRKSRADETVDLFTGKRTQHNNLERQRRNDLKLSFLRLRAAVPTLGGHDRAPKVIVLRKAAEYIVSAQKLSYQLEKEYAQTHAHHERLQRKLSQLQQHR